MFVVDFFIFIIINCMISVVVAGHSRRNIVPVPVVAKSSTTTYGRVLPNFVAFSSYNIRTRNPNNVVVVGGGGGGGKISLSTSSRTPRLVQHHHQRLYKREFSQSNCLWTRRYSTTADDNNTKETTTTTTISEMTKSLSSSSSLPLLSEFLIQQKINPTNHIVIGNEAGDADSIISAIAFAYLSSIQKNESRVTTTTTINKTPIVSITQKDLQTQRPETIVLLQKLAGISIQNHLLYLNEWIEQVLVKQQHQQQTTTTYNVTLTDHNRFRDILPENIMYKVIEIYDHHLDYGDHFDTCVVRKIAFEDQKALVASTCTLVVEEIQNIIIEGDDVLFPPDLAVVLLGVILLDSVNMDPSAGKGTVRDQIAIDTLLHNTDWGQLPELQSLLTEDMKPDTSKLFTLLQGAKFAPEFWNSLSVQDTLRLDYKYFTIENNNNNNNNSDPTVGLGVSTVLMSMNDFVRKDNWVDNIQQYLNERQMSFLGIMFASTDPKEDSKLKRQLMLCAKPTFPIDELVTYLHNDGSLKLVQVYNDSLSTTTTPNLRVVAFEQGATEASRKQVAPILIQFFEQNISHL